MNNFSFQQRGKKPTKEKPESETMNFGPSGWRCLSFFYFVTWM